MQRAYVGPDGKFFCASCFESDCECRPEERDQFGHCQIGCCVDVPTRYEGRDVRLHCASCCGCLLHSCSKEGAVHGGQEEATSA